MESAPLSRPSLPPFHSLGMDKYKREEVEYQNRPGDKPATTMPSAPVATTAPNSYPSGPPPPYSASFHSTTHAPTIAPHSFPTEAHRQPVDDNDGGRQQTKHSLPSLHEALGNPSSEPARVANPPEAPYTPSYAHSHAGYTRTQRGPHTYPERRSSDYDHSSYPRSTYHPQSPRSATSQRPSENHTYPAVDARDRETYERLPPPPPPSQSSAHPGASQSFGYGYAPYPPRFAPSAPAPPSAPVFQPSINLPSPSQPAGGWRHENATGGAPLPREPAAAESSANPTYGESVKRHLDMYDFELALTEIADYSTTMLDFSRSYGARLHQTQRSGPLPGTLPAITEVDELMNKSRYTLDALSRLREVLVAQQAAYIQQVQEQRFKTESDLKRNDSVHHIENAKNDGFNGPEPKKRRGRAAAPGRCHSCNRAETPEWRRGPDGARTLCNACGLHYAKLTRKAGANNKAAIGSSNLRPKSSERDLDDSQQQDE